MKTTMQIIQWKHWKTTSTLLTIGALVLIFTTGAGKPPKGPSDIPLRVTIESFGLVASDGKGEYRNGDKGVIAVFTAGQGRFSFDTGNRRNADVTIPGFLNQGNYRVNLLVSRDVQDPNVNTNPDPNWHDLDLGPTCRRRIKACGFPFYDRDLTERHRKLAGCVRRLSAGHGTERLSLCRRGTGIRDSD
jgi:hypothetical protein